MAPTLFIILAILTVTIFVGPRKAVVTTRNRCVSRPFAANFLRNCGAVSAFTTLVFNVLVISIVHDGNIASSGAAYACLVCTNLVTTTNLTFICISLFCLNTADTNVTTNINGNNTVSRRRSVRSWACFCLGVTRVGLLWRVRRF